MGKNKHSKDRMFLTATEWKMDYGGKKQVAGKNNQYHILPFDHCALSLTPFVNPCCTPEGVMFEFEYLFSFLRKYKTNPVSGDPMTTNDILRLHIAKNPDGQWHCPVTFKVFNNNTHIVAIRTTGNVYEYEAVYELNIKASNYTDLLTGEPFQRTDIITLQNPDDIEHVKLRNIDNFKYLQTMREDAAENSRTEIRHNTTAERVMKEYEKTQKDNEMKAKQIAALNEPPKEFTEDVDAILQLQPTTEDITPGHMMLDQRTSRSLTSTSFDVHTEAEMRLATPDEIREARWRFMRQVGKKAYIQLQTNYGALNLEIHCDWAPRTSWNFVTLCEKGYYNDTKFHRLVPGFVLQGGDPTGTGAGGVSAWGKSFKDEFDSRLLHDSRGILSMANSGANTNNSQFFITLAATAHLDMKHPIFGRLVGGSNVLDAIEAIGAGLKEKPNEDILILGTHVFVNPIPEADALLIQTLTDAQNHRLGRTTAIPAKPSQQGPLTSTPSALNKQTTEPSAVGIRKGNGTTSTSIVNEAAVAAFMRSEGAIVDEGRSIEPQSKKKKLSNFENW